MTAVLEGVAARVFMLAGNAIVTIENPRTGGRFTYRVEAPRKKVAPVYDGARFVSVLAGPDNASAYKFIGTIFGDGRFDPQRSWIAAAASRAFAWTWERVRAGRPWLPAVIRHAGRCGRCGRLLTVPESVDSGLGPECARRMAA